MPTLGKYVGSRPITLRGNQTGQTEALIPKEARVLKKELGTGLAKVHGSNASTRAKYAVLSEIRDSLNTIDCV